MSNKFSNNNKTHYTNPYKSGFSKNVPSNASNFKKNFNKQKPINYNSNNTGNFSLNRSGMNNGTKPIVYGGGRRFDNKPGHKGLQINLINSNEFSTLLCQKFQDMMLTAKMSTLIAIYLIMLFLPGVIGQVKAPPGYTIEPCNAPRIPNFYRLTDSYLDSLSVLPVTLTAIQKDCQMNTAIPIKDRFEFGDWFIS